jgi:hypothetical protein
MDGQTTPATDPAATTPAATTPATVPATTPAVDPEEPKGAPDYEKAYKRGKTEIEGLKTQLADLQGKLDAAKTLEDVEKAKTDAIAEAKAAHDAKVLDLSIEMALTKAGCVNTKATMALLDREGISLSGDTVKGLDTAELVKTYPYLFSTAQKVATGAAPVGATTPRAANINDGVAAYFKKK